MCPCRTPPKKIVESITFFGQEGDQEYPSRHSGGHRGAEGAAEPQEARARDYPIPKWLLSRQETSSLRSS